MESSEALTGIDYCKKKQSGASAQTPDAFYHAAADIAQQLADFANQNGMNDMHFYDLISFDF